MIGPITPENCCQVAGLMMSSVAVRVTPGVKSLTFTIRRPLVRRYTTLLITMVSVTGCTITVTVAGALTGFGATLLVAVTWKVKVCAGVSSGTEGAVKVTDEPVVDDNVTPAGAVQLKVDVHGAPGASAGSTQVAFRVTGAPLATVIVVPVTVGGGGGRFGSTGAGFGPGGGGVGKAGEQQAGPATITSKQKTSGRCA